MRVHLPTISGEGDMTSLERLTRSQIVMLRSLVMRGGSVRAISLDHHWQSKPALPLWRRGLIEIWYRQVAGEQPSLQCPYYGLSTVGVQIASSFLPAPRGFSGAEQER